MRIETERLLLRGYTLEDTEDLFAVFSDPNVMKHVETPYDYQKTKEFILKYGMCTTPRVFALVEKASSKVIGHVLFGSVDEDEIYELGWILGKSYWKKGYAYEISTALIDYGFRQMNLHKIVAETNDPIKSLGLMKKLGMILEGVQREHSKYPNEWRDLYWYGILKSDVQL